VCVVVRVELLLLLNYCRCGTVGAELLLVSSYWCSGNRHVCAVVGVELLLLWN